MDRVSLAQRATVVPLALPDLPERMVQRVIRETVDPPALKGLLEKRGIPALEVLPVLPERTVSPVRSALRERLA